MGDGAVKGSITIDEKKRMLREMYEKGEISFQTYKILMKELEESEGRKPKILRVYVIPSSQRKKESFWEKLKRFLIRSSTKYG